jgi:hypothetical protein
LIFKIRSRGSKFGLAIVPLGNPEARSIRFASHGEMALDVYERVLAHSIKKRITPGLRHIRKLAVSSRTQCCPQVGFYSLEILISANPVSGPVD